MSCYLEEQKQEKTCTKVEIYLKRARICIAGKFRHYPHSGASDGPHISDTIITTLY